MARTRLLSPKFFLDDDLAERSAYARLTFAGLPCLADREGRIEDRPKVISAELFPFEDVDMEAILDELAATRNGSVGGFILRYEVAGRRYIQIRNFLKYQNPHFRELPSSIPAPCMNHAPPAEPKAEPNAQPGGIDPVIDPDPVSVMSVSASSKPPKRSVSKFHWDEEHKRVWGSDEDRRKLKEKWLARGFTAEEFKAELAKLNLWLEDRPGKRREGSNFTNRMNNWLNNALANLMAREVRE